MPTSRISPRRAVRKIVDTNFLQDDRLREYLLESPRNYAVLPDYLAMEAYKGNTLASIYPSMEILALRPDQVIVLKSTGLAAAMVGRVARFPNCLIDRDQTRGFRQFCSALQAAKAGDALANQDLLQHGSAASAHIARVGSDAPTFTSGASGLIAFITRQHTPAELDIVRADGVYTDDMKRKREALVCQLARDLFRAGPAPIAPPTVGNLRDTFIFRCALCTYVFLVRAVRTGGAPTSLEKVRNTIIDFNFVAFATYFDGFLSGDRVAVDTYERVTVLLRDAFPRPPFWLRFVLRRKFY